MRASESPTLADQRLIEAIQALGGAPPTPRQLERWRQAGAIPATVRRFPGRGSESSYPEGTDWQTLELVALLDRYRSLDKAILVLFGRGWPIAEEGLKRAYEWLFDEARNDILRFAHQADPAIRGEPEEPDDNDIADAAGSAFAKRMQRSRLGRAMARNVRRMPERAESIDAIMASVFSNLSLLALRGQAFSPEGLREMGAAVGVDAAKMDWESFVDGAHRLMLPAVRAVVNGATLRELEMARGVASAIVEGHRAQATGARLESGADPMQAGLNFLRLSLGVADELAVPMHAAFLLVFLPMIGRTVERAHEELTPGVTTNE